MQTRTGRLSRNETTDPVKVQPAALLRATPRASYNVQDGGDKWGAAFFAFCEAAGHDPATLPEKTWLTWRAKLKGIAENWEVGPDVLEHVINKKPDSNLHFKDTWRTPWAAADDIGAMILQYKSGGVVAKDWRGNGGQRLDTLEPELAGVPVAD